ALANAKMNAQRISGENKHRQLMLASRMYVEDNRDTLPFAYVDDNPANKNYRFAWVHGILDYDNANTANWNVTNTIMTGAIWPYTGGALQIYRCPADVVRVKPTSGPFKGQSIPRVRSMSMYSWMGMNEGAYTWFGAKVGNRSFRTYLKKSDIGEPSATTGWVPL